MTLLDAGIHLNANGLRNVILTGKEVSNQDMTKIIIFLLHHLHEELKVEYLTVKDPLELWNDLKGRYEHKNL